MEEWKILRDYEKWKCNGATSPTGGKRYYSSSGEDPLSSDAEMVVKAKERPMGNKKQKAMKALESKADEWFEKIGSTLSAKDTNQERLLDVMKENVNQSEKNREFLKEILTAQTDKLAMQLQKSTALKALTKLDLSTMSAEFQLKARQKLEQEIGSILNF